MAWKSVLSLHNTFFRKKPYNFMPLEAVSF